MGVRAARLLDRRENKTGVDILLPRGLWWTVGFVAVYSLLWVVADIVGDSFAGGNGLSIWYINAALDVTLFLVMGWRWWPLPVALLALSIVASPGDRWGSLALNVIAQTPYELLLALAVKVTVDSLGVCFPLRNVRDVAGFAGVVCIVGSAIANAAFVAMYSIVDPRTNPWSTFPTQFLRGAIADTTAMIVLVPVITQFMAWKAPSESAATAQDVKLGRTFVLGLAATAAVVVAEYTIGARIGRILVEFSLLPLAWLAITYGMRGAAIGILVADITATLTPIFLRLPVDSQIEYQGYLVASALLALLLGAIATERQGLLDRLRHVAYFDALTNLPNTGRLLDWIRKAGERPAILAMIDIAELRLLNEGLGREAADSVIVGLATRLRGGLSQEYFVARVGSGEFAVATAQAIEPSTFITAVASLLSESFDVGGSRVFVEAAIGVAQSGDSGTPGELLRRSELSVRRAKSSPTKVMLYEDAIETTAAPLLVVELHRAAERDEFVPFFQPIYRYADGHWSLTGAEVLMRWQHPERGVLAPADFIDLLERLSICTRVGWDLLEESLMLAMSWRSVIPNFSVWVNFFPRQIFEVNCVDRILTAIANAKAVPEALVVEITERIVVSEEIAVASIVQGLRSSGVRTAIDDFGTGGSSLGRVRELPVDILKMDRSFVNRCEVDAKTMSVAKTIVRLADELGMSVLAEGIENALQVEAMIEIGCKYGQGYELGHPIPAALFERVVLTQSKAS